MDIIPSLLSLRSLCLRAPALVQVFSLMLIGIFFLVWSRYYKSLPPISKAYETLCMLTTVGYQLGLYDKLDLALYYPYVFHRFQGSSDGPEQYVAIMNAIFSAQRSMVPIDSCYLGSNNSAFLQQASYITGGVYLKPQQPDGLFQYLSTVFATDLHSRTFLQLPKSVGVDFRASCFCHKKTIDMGYICSVCLSIFCKHHKKCSTCGSVFGQAQSDNDSAPNWKRKFS